MGELVFFGIWAVIAVVMFCVSFQFPVLKIDPSGGGGVFPRIVIIVFMSLMLLRTIQVFVTKQTKKKFNFIDIFKGPSLVYLLVTLVYFLVVKYVGFLVSTILYLLGMMFYCYRVSEGKYQSKKHFLIMSILVLVGVTAFDWLFASQLKVLLPKGILGF